MLTKYVVTKCVLTECVDKVYVDKVCVDKVCVDKECVDKECVEWEVREEREEKEKAEHGSTESKTRTPHKVVGKYESQLGLLFPIYGKSKKSYSKPPISVYIYIYIMSLDSWHSQIASQKIQSHFCALAEPPGKFSEV